MATAKPKTDGRVQRSERSREAILNALEELVNEGVLMPTAQEVSARAEVGIRSVFRHFADMNCLYTQMDIRATEKFSKYFDAEIKTGSLNERIQHTIENLHKGFEENKYTLMTTLRRLDSAVMLKQYRKAIASANKNFEQRVPEVRELPESTRNAVEVAKSFSTYERLRSIQNLSQKKSIAVVTEMIVALMNQH